MKAKKKVKKTKKQKRYGVFFPIGNRVVRSSNFPKNYSTKDQALKTIEGQNHRLEYGVYTVKEIA